MGLDPLTLLTASAIALASMGVLLIALSFEERATIALRWWGGYFLLGALGLALVLSSPNHANAPPRELATTIVLVAYGLLFAACRVFNGRSGSWPRIILGGAVWLIFCLTAHPSGAECSAVAAVLTASYCVAGGAELWRGNQDDLKLQNLAAWVLVIQASFYLSRIVFGPVWAPHVKWIETVASPWGAALGAETLAFLFFFGFLTIAMTRERIAHRLRKASLEDALTRIGNRRALFQKGQALLDRCRAAGGSAALVLFDLDHFKTINDTHGHYVGDLVLVRFAALGTECLPRESLFCRVGGEEFAALVPNTSPSEVRALTEIIRMRLQQSAIDGKGAPVTATVSAGIAMTAPGAPNLDLLYACADLHLYRAKATGRNRVADASRDPVEISHLKKAS